METEPTHKESSCPTAEELAAYADLTLTGAARRTLRQHLRGCTDCSRAVLAMQRALSPIRDRHQGGGGWRGPWEDVQGKLPEDVAPAWEEHRKHCARCQTRTQLLSVRKPVLQLGGLSFAAGLAVMLVAFPLRQPRVAPVEWASKGTTSEVLPSGVVGILTRYLNPPDSQLTHMIGYWEDVRQRSPENPASYAALLPLYQRAAQRETDPKRHAEIESYRQQLKALCQERLK